MEVALSLESAWWGGDCAVPGATQTEVQGAVGYPVWNPAGGRGWRQGVIVIGGWGNGEPQSAAGSRLEPGYKASTKGPSGQDRPRPWG